jgi:hypothetical protein
MITAFFCFIASILLGACIALYNILTVMRASRTAMSLITVHCIAAFFYVSGILGAITVAAIALYNKL